MLAAVGGEGLQSLDVSMVQRSGTQSRKQLNKTTVEDVRQDIRNGDPIAPIIVFYDGNQYWIADGYHRFEAHLKEKRDIIGADVRRGSREAALHHNIKSNASADQTRWTGDDKRNAVTMLLQSYGNAKVTRKQADEIGALCRASHWLVETIASEIARQNLPASTAPVQPPSSQAVAVDVHREEEEQVGRERRAAVVTAVSPSEEPPKADKRRQARNARSDVADRKRRDEEIAKLATQGMTQARICDQLGIHPTTVSDSFRRQGLNPDQKNPLIKILEQAQLVAGQWEDNHHRSHLPNRVPASVASGTKALSARKIALRSSNWAT